MAIKKSVALLLTPALLAGCYTYTAIEPANVPTGSTVRARVSAATASRVSTEFGLTDARLLTGTLVDNQASGALTLEIPSTPSGTTGAERGLFQRVTLNRGDLLELESKRIDRTKTTLVIGGVAVAAGVFLGTAIVRGRSSGEGAVVEPPPNLTIGIFRFRF